MYIIVGIDPGKTSAIAAIDLDGRLLHSAHKTFAGVDWLTNEIRSVGIPVVIAGDNPEVNRVVRKINAARRYHPEQKVQQVYTDDHNYYHADDPRYHRVHRNLTDRP